MATGLYLSIPDLTDEKGAARPGTVLINSVPYVQVSDFSFGLAAGPGAAAGKLAVELNPLTVVLTAGAVTPLLLQACAGGTRFPSASLIVQEGAVTTQKYEFKTVAVLALSVTGSAGGEQQSLTLGYSSLQVTCTPLNAQGQPEAPSTGGFDFTTGKIT